MCSTQFFIHPNEVASHWRASTPMPMGKLAVEAGLFMACLSGETVYYVWWKI